jgi:hypothetical protein
VRRHVAKHSGVRVPDAVQRERMPKGLGERGARRTAGSIFPHSNRIVGEDVDHGDSAKMHISSYISKI